MKLENRTAHAARLLRTASATSDDHMLACVIARPTYRVVDGALVATPDEPWPIADAPTPTALGPMPGDKPFYAGGIDVLVGGAVRQAGGAARPTLDVEIAVGRGFRRRIAVFGDRVWAAGAKGDLVPSEPVPFLSMPLDYARAYGGAAKTAYGLSMPFSPNKQGRGFYLDAAGALGGPLPNLEDPARRIRTIHDTPDPVGLGYYPSEGGLRMKAAVTMPALDGAQFMGASPPEVPFGPDHVLPTLFNAGHPGMFIEAGGEPEAGELIRVTHGLSDGGNLEFAMPALAMHVRVELEDRQFAFPMHVDQIGIVAGVGRVFFSLRSIVEYRIVPGERRTITLADGPPP